MHVMTRETRDTLLFVLSIAWLACLLGALLFVLFAR